jgi:hypothetical protein
MAGQFAFSSHGLSAERLKVLKWLYLEAKVGTVLEGHSRAVGVPRKV